MTRLHSPAELLRSNFNPHEREARDATAPEDTDFWCSILIHTSVKLVTGFCLPAGRSGGNFNPHEREARDKNYRP